MCNHYCTSTKMKVAKVRAELKTFVTADLKRICYNLRCQCCLNDKLSILLATILLVCW